MATTSPTEKTGDDRIAGFSLIELMLVIMVIGIVIATATPYMAKSIRGNRLRFAAQSVVSAGRYARSMAVMSQSDVVLTFDLDASSLSVDRGGASRPQAEQPAEVPATEPATDPSTAGARDSSGTNAAPITSSPMPRLKRRLDEVKIASVDIDGAGSSGGGACSITYSRAGTCAPYTVRLADTRGDSMTIEVDALAGARVERGL